MLRQATGLDESSGRRRDLRKLAGSWTKTEVEEFEQTQQGSLQRKDLDLLDELLAQPGVALQPIARREADRFGLLVKALRQAGTPIPTNDIWIAAAALCRARTAASATTAPAPQHLFRVTIFVHRTEAQHRGTTQRQLHNLSPPASAPRPSPRDDFQVGSLALQDLEQALYQQNLVIHQHNA